MSILFSGVGHSLTPVTLTRSMKTSFSKMTSPKYLIRSVTVVPWTSSHILYGLPLHQKGDVSKATC